MEPILLLGNFSSREREKKKKNRAGGLRVETLTGRSVG